MTLKTLLILFLVNLSSIGFGQSFLVESVSKTHFMNGEKIKQGAKIDIKDTILLKSKGALNIISEDNRNISIIKRDVYRIDSLFKIELKFKTRNDSIDAIFKARNDSVDTIIKQTFPEGLIDKPSNICNTSRLSSKNELGNLLFQHKQIIIINAADSTYHERFEGMNFNLIIKDPNPQYHKPYYLFIQNLFAEKIDFIPIESYNLTIDFNAYKNYRRDGKGFYIVSLYTLDGRNTEMIVFKN